jgi:hypothetical protein
MDTTTNTRNNNVMSDLQKKIFGERNEVLTPMEINRLFQYPITPEFIVTLYRALQDGAIDPDVTVLQVLTKAKTKDYLIPIALCLRFGADANMYVQAPNIGIIHILGYIYITLSKINADPSVMTAIVLMFLGKGARATLPLFDKKAGQIRKPGEMIPTTLTVSEWLNDQGYNTILDKVDINDPYELEKIMEDKETLVKLSLLLDDPVLMIRDYKSSDLSLAIKCFSTMSFDKIPIPFTMVMMDHKTLWEAVDYLNATAFDKLLLVGQLPSYLLMNKIIMTMIRFKDTGFIVAVQELRKMLLAAIAIGTQLDKDQLNLISMLGQDVLVAVNKEYEQPYWRKICKSNTANHQAPEALRRLAISLNLDSTMSKNGICDAISSLAQADPDIVKEAARRRQQLRMSSDLGYITEFIQGNIPALVPRNKNLLQYDAFDYNDIDVAYYRDDQGAVWYFSSDMFASLVETGKNPYNNTMMPPSFMETLKCQMDVLKRLGIDVNEGEVGVYASKIAVTYDKSIDSLQEKDIVSEKASERAVNRFIQLACENGVSSDTIKSLTKEKMIESLKSIQFNVNYQSLSTSHALVTTARIIQHVNKTNPQLTKTYFNALRGNLML